MMRGNRLPALGAVLESTWTPCPLSPPLLHRTAGSGGRGRILKRDRCQSLVNPRAYSSIPHAYIETGHGRHEGLRDPEIKVSLGKSG